MLRWFPFEANFFHGVDVWSRLIRWYNGPLARSQMQPSSPTNKYGTFAWFASVLWIIETLCLNVIVTLQSTRRIWSNDDRKLEEARVCWSPMRRHNDLPWGSDVICVAWRCDLRTIHAYPTLKSLVNDYFRVLPFLRQRVTRCMAFSASYNGTKLWVSSRFSERTWTR